MSEGWKCVVRCPVFKKTCQHLETRCLCHTTRWGSVVQYVCKYNFCQYYSSIYEILSLSCSQDFFSTADSLRKLIDYPASNKRKYFPIREVTLAMQNHFKLTLGLVLLAVTSRQNEAKRCVEEGKNTPSISCRLKYATFLYRMDDIDTCLQVVHGILTRYKHNTLPMCMDTKRVVEAFSLYPDYMRKVLELVARTNDFEIFITNCAFSVFSSRWEVKSCPPGIQHVAETRQLRTKIDHKFSSLVFVDSLVYIYYLLFLCYTDKRKLAESDQSLNMLRELAEYPAQYYIFYPEVAKPLYEYCRDNRSRNTE